MKTSFNPLSITGLAKQKPPRVDPKYAGLNRRMMAATIDSLIMLPIAPVIDWCFTKFYPEIPINLEDFQTVPAMVAAVVGSGFLKRWLWGVFAQTAGLYLITAICWHFWSATPGKMILRLRIVDADTGARMNTRQIFIRLFGYIPSSAFLLLGFFWIVVDKRRQAWHDKMANTVVVISPWKKADFIPVKSNSPAAGLSSSPEPSVTE